MEYGSTLQKSVREGNKNTILPLIAYYGTGRLYMQKKLKKMLLKIQGFPERQAILIAWIQLLMINKCCSGLSR